MPKISGECFTHYAKDNLQMKSGTYLSALSFDKDFIAAATCDPANANRLEEGSEKLFLFDLKEFCLTKTIQVPKLVSVVKLVYPKWIIYGHFDGNLNVWSFTDEIVHVYKGHLADILAVDVNEVSLTCSIQ